MTDALSRLRAQVDEHLSVARQVAQALLPRVEAVAGAMAGAFAAGRRLYSFGNGGSAADAMHFAEELIARYRRDRRALPAVSLSADPTALTCIGNDYGFEQVFSRQVEGLVQAGDVVAGLTTSGNSPNVLRGLKAAKDRGAVTVLFSAGAGGQCAPHADHCLLVPATHTARVQEMHILLIHLLCEAMDDWLLGGQDEKRE